MHKISVKSKPPLRASLDPRKAALQVLERFGQNRSKLDVELHRLFEAYGSFSKQDRAFIQSLVFGVVRWQAELDWVIDQFSRIPRRKMDARVLNILRLGVFQMLHLSKTPASAAVNTSVQLAKPWAPPWTVKFINAVLRRCAAHHAEVVYPDMRKDPLEALSVTKSFPSWLIGRWLARFGAEETAQLCDVINRLAPITVRANLLKTTRSDLIGSLNGLVQEIETTPYAPEGISFVRPASPLPELAPFSEGLFQVQDEASQLVTHLLGPRPGETLLDACAGLGGKTGHMVQMMRNKGRIIALDFDPRKLSQLRIAMQRLGITIVLPLCHDMDASEAPFAEMRFDRILLDAPCSGLGVLRRHPDIKWAKKAEDMPALHKRQCRFLLNLAPLLKPGGLLVYSVCSMEPEENDDVIAAFLKQRPDFRILTAPPGLPPAMRPLIGTDGCLRTFPQRHNMDGFFAVALQRRA